MTLTSLTNLLDMSHAMTNPLIVIKLHQWRDLYICICIYIFVHPEIPRGRDVCTSPYNIYIYRAFQLALVVKNLPASAGDIRDVGLISGLERSPGGGHGNPL